jgi:hypothetical protein
MTLLMDEVRQTLNFTLRKNNMLFLGDFRSCIFGFGSLVDTNALMLLLGLIRQMMHIAVCTKSDLDSNWNV